MTSTLIRAEDAPRFEVHGASVTAYASPSRGSAALATWRVRLAAGASSPQHALDSDEIFMCLSGAAEFSIGADTLTVRAGDTLTVARNTSFRFRVLGDVPFEAVACVSAGCQARIENGEPFCPPWSL